MFWFFQNSFLRLLMTKKMWLNKLQSGSFIASVSHKKMKNSVCSFPPFEMIPPPPMTLIYASIHHSAATYDDVNAINYLSQNCDRCLSEDGKIFPLTMLFYFSIPSIWYKDTNDTNNTNYTNNKNGSHNRDNTNDYSTKISTSLANLCTFSSNIVFIMCSNAVPQPVLILEVLYWESKRKKNIYAWPEFKLMSSWRDVSSSTVLLLFQHCM